MAEPEIIEFNSIDLDRVLEAIVKDGDNGLLEPLYSNQRPDEPFKLQPILINSDGEPNMRNWTGIQRSHYLDNCIVHYNEGDWDETCYNTENNMVEVFDPVTVHPKPALVRLGQSVEAYQTLFELATRVEDRGYMLEVIQLAKESSEHGFFGLNFNRVEGSFFQYQDVGNACRYFSHLVPGIPR